MRIDPGAFPAFAFDLDGVITDTAAVHAAAWKQLFDELLSRLANGAEWQPFTDREYRAYVDGKPRRDGLRSFLASRDIVVPEGLPDDDARAETIHGLALRKNDYVLQRIARDGVTVYRDAVALLRTARAHGVRTAVVTASENCREILGAAGLASLFDTRVDGLTVKQLALRGKPAPDSFLEAAHRLRTSPSHTVVFEDAIAGVQAGRAGQFGIVVGVDRVGHAAELRESGADVVVSSLDEIELVPEGARVELR